MKVDNKINGNMLTKTFPNGRSNTYHYNALNRLTSIDYPDGSHDFFGFNVIGNLLSSMGPLQQQY